MLDFVHIQNFDSEPSTSYSIRPEIGDKAENVPRFFGGDVEVQIIRNDADAEKVLDYLTHEEGLKGLDFETSGLNPEYSEVRLTQLAYQGVVYIIDHAYCLPFQHYAETIALLSELCCFKNKFEGDFIDYYSGNDNVELMDVGHMRRAIYGGRPMNFKQLVKLQLGVDLSKEEQKSDWTGKLTQSQYLYATLDAFYTEIIAQQLYMAMDEDQFRGFCVINNAWRCVNQIERTGLLLDLDYHRKLINIWTRRKNTAYRALRKMLPEGAIENLNSKHQFSKFFKSVLDDEFLAVWPQTKGRKGVPNSGILKSDKDTLKAMGALSSYPMTRLLAAFRVYNKASKYLSTYGESLADQQIMSHDGRLHGRVNMAQAATGRMSSSGPNTQNFPNAEYFRAAFIADEGFKIVVRDYSGIEVRVLADISGDDVLMYDAIYDDIHSQSACAIWNHDPDEFKLAVKRKEGWATVKRRKAKGFTFQLLYGAGPAALAIVLGCTVDEAEAAIAAWANRYKEAYSYRHKVFDKLGATGFMKCVSGRTIYVPKRDRDLPKAANYPVQGSAADLMYLAMTKTYTAIAESGLEAAVCASVHDELLILAAEEHAEKANMICAECMTEAWLELFNSDNVDNLHDGGIGDNWAVK